MQVTTQSAIACKQALAAEKTFELQSQSELIIIAPF